MGQFSAGRWIVGLSIYFAVFYLICFSIAGAVNATSGENAGVTFNDPGFGSNPPTGTINNPGNVTSIDYDTSGDSYSSGVSAWGIMTGINAENTSVGNLGGWSWVFSIFFFWIPGIMYLWCIYMALPFLH